MLDYVCSHCATMLCVGMAEGDMAGFVIRCRCGTMNLIPRAAA